MVFWVPMLKVVSLPFKMVLHCARLPDTRVPLVAPVGITNDWPTFNVLIIKSVYYGQATGGFVLVSCFRIQGTNLHWGSGRCPFPTDNRCLFRFQSHVEGAVQPLHSFDRILRELDWQTRIQVERIDS